MYRSRSVVATAFLFALAACESDGREATGSASPSATGSTTPAADAGGVPFGPGEALWTDGEQGQFNPVAWHAIESHTLAIVTRSPVDQRPIRGALRAATQGLVRDVMQWQVEGKHPYAEVIVDPAGLAAFTYGDETKAAWFQLKYDRAARRVETGRRWKGKPGARPPTWVLRFSRSRPPGGRL